MEIEIFGTESLGVRGMCCLIRTKERCILIDPGVALGYRRRGLLPHPCQIAAGDEIRNSIISAFSEATDIVFSHYHGDHVPLADANPYQLSLKGVPSFYGKHVWCKGEAGISPKSLKRRDDILKFAEETGWDVTDAEETTGPVLSFSAGVFHGTAGSRQGTVMMTCVREEDFSFVHASDIQMLESLTVGRILEWKPDIVFASGPPLYLEWISDDDRRSALENASELADSVSLLILDHHLLRSREGYRWLLALSEKSGGNVISAADFMGKKPALYEAARDEMYDKIPVPAGWHGEYSKGRVDFRDFDCREVDI